MENSLKYLVEAPVFDPSTVQRAIPLTNPGSSAASNPGSNPVTTSNRKDESCAHQNYRNAVTCNPAI